MRIHIQNLVTFANDVDNTVGILENRVSKQTSPVSPCHEEYEGITDKSLFRGEAPLEEKRSIRNTYSNQDDLSKLVRSLRRLFLCMCDLFDMLENCVEQIDSSKKKSLYIQIEPSVTLIRVDAIEFVVM